MAIIGGREYSDVGLHTVVSQQLVTSWGGERNLLKAMTVQRQ
jgi:hypothetical protein